jgi:hypothetical protein
MEVAEPLGAAPSVLADRAAGANTSHTGCRAPGGVCYQQDVWFSSRPARGKSLVQLLAHRAGHRALPESVVTELHCRQRWWQSGRQPAAQTGRAMHNAIRTCARNTVDSEAPQRFLVTVVPRYMPDAGEACLQALHSSAEVDTD